MKLKKILLFTAITFSLISNNAEAQDAEVGIKGGVSFSNFFNKEIDDQNMRTGVNGGLFFKAPITSFLAIQPEILYVNKGSTTKYDNFISGDGALSQNLDYLEVPILAVINLNENINIHGGPYFAYLLNASIDNESENSDLNFVEGLNEDNFQRLDYGVSAGLGFEFEVIRFGARYDYGLREVGKEQSFTLDESEAISNEFKKSRNSAFLIYLGLSF